jgi:predicted PurR-regulated permease PerM
LQKGKFLLQYKPMQTKIIERYFFFGLLLASFIFAFMIFRPFWIVLLLGISFSIVIYPIYKWLIKRKVPTWLASFLTVITFAVIVLGPISGVGVLIFNQSQNVYKVIVEGDSIKPFIQTMDNAVNKILPKGIEFDVKQKASELAFSITNNIAKIFSTTLSAFFSFILLLLAIFYFLKDGANWRKSLIDLSPLADDDDRKIIDRLSIAINGVVKGYLLIALVQGVLMGIGLWIFGIPNAALWGVVAGIASLVPMIGTSFVSVPSIAFLLVSGDSSQAIGLLIWSVVIVGLVDNFLNPIVVGGKMNIPPLLILFAVLGGISLLGPIGVLVGPLAISLLYTLISIYRNEFRDTATK